MSCCPWPSKSAEKHCGGLSLTPRGQSSERTPSIRRWQEKLLQRVSLGLAIALALSVILVHELSRPRTMLQHWCFCVVP